MDSQLKHVLAEVGTPGSTRKLLLSQDIRSLENLIAFQEQLRNGIIILNAEEDRKKLLAVIRWREANPTANVEEDFEDIVIKDFLVTEEVASNEVGKEWHHICTVVGIPQGSRQKLEENDVRTLDSLMEFQHQLEGAKPAGSVWEEDSWKEVQEKLLAFIKWRLNNKTADVVNGFGVEAYETIFKHQRVVVSYINLALGKPFQQEHKDLFDVIESENLLDAVTKEVQKTVMSSQNLREQCSNFDYDSFLEKVVRHLHSLNAQSRGGCNGIQKLIQKLIAVAGRTQSGKSAVKGVVQSLAARLKLPLIVLTKGLAESLDLHAKLVKMCDGTMMKAKHVVVASSKNDGLGHRMKQERIDDALAGITHGGTLVIADTHAQVINKACKAIKKYREAVPGGEFILVVDEVDAMIRSKDGHQVFERALQQLLDLKPCINIGISATPVPFMLHLLSKGKDKDSLDFFNLEKSDDYVGVEDMKPLEIDGEPVFLELDELTKATDIPYTNEKVFALYYDALRPGAVVLDCTSPFVTASGNVKEKATAVQRKMRDEKRVDIAVVTFTGQCLSVKMPHKAWNHETYRKSLVSDLLRDIPFQTPVIIFGYSKMRRGISFRDAERVSTHMVLCLGKGHHCGTLVQAIGRATFKGRSVLRKNGFEHVTILMPRNDFTVVVNYQRYVDHVHRRIQKGDSFADAVTGANELVPDSANFLRETFRELSSIRGERQEYLDLVQHEEPKGLSDTEKVTKDKLWNDVDAQKLLRSIDRLKKSHPQIHLDDIKDDLEESEKHPLSVKRVRALLATFRTTALIDKDPIEKDVFKVTKTNRNRLSLFMNEEFGDITDSQDGALDYESSEDEAGTTEFNDEDDPSQPVLLTQDLSVLNSSQTLSNKRRSGAFQTPSNKRRRMQEGCNIVTPPSAGTRNCPIELDDDEDDKSIIEIQRVAKFVGDNSDSAICFGTVIGKYDDSEKWWVQYYNEVDDDFDNEDVDQEQLQVALQLYQMHKGKDTSNTSIMNSSIVENIPMIPPDDLSRRGRCVVQAKRRVYYADASDTPSKIARRYNVEAKTIVAINKERKEYKYLTQKSRFEFNSPIVLPLGDE